MKEKTKQKKMNAEEKKNDDHHPIILLRDATRNEKGEVIVHVFTTAGTWIWHPHLHENKKGEWLK